MSKYDIWPEYPKVVLVDNQIHIFYEDGTSILWGEEDKENEALVMAEIQDGLRAIKYFSIHIKETIAHCMQVLEVNGVSKERSTEYLVEAIKTTIFNYFLPDEFLSS